MFMIQQDDKSKMCKLYAGLRRCEVPETRSNCADERNLHSSRPFHQASLSTFLLRTVKDDTLPQICLVNFGVCCDVGDRTRETTELVDSENGSVKSLCAVARICAFPFKLVFLIQILSMK